MRVAGSMAGRVRPPLEASQALLHIESQTPGWKAGLLVPREGRRRSRRDGGPAGQSLPPGGTECAAPAGGSHVLERVRAFLPVLGAANEQLERRLRERPAADLDIEVLSGGDGAAHIEMDLALGVAELRTAAAVAAAERAVCGQATPSRDGPCSGGESSSSSGGSPPSSPGLEFRDLSPGADCGLLEGDAVAAPSLFEESIVRPCDGLGRGSVRHVSARGEGRRRAGQPRKRAKIEEL